ncbi:MAG: tetratricopeptide repeat protein [Bryobacteraceae bacterium]
MYVLAVGLVSPQSGNFDDLARRASDALDTNPQEAAALYEQAVALRPGWADGWLYRGAALFRLGRFREARDSLRQGVALAPAKGTPLAFLGMAEYELGDYRQAISDILKGEAIGLADKPDFITAVHYRAALCYLRFSDFPLALEQLKPLVKSGIQSDAVTQALGVSVLALRYLPLTLPREKQELVNLAGRAAWAFLAERPNEATPLFAQLVSRFPGEPGVHYMNGVFLLDHDPDAAEQEFRRELQITPSHVLARVQLALLLSRSGDTAAAVQLASEAASLEPSNPMCQVTLGRVLLGAGRTGQAIAALEKAEKIAPDAARTHFYLEQAYRRAGRSADALKEEAEWRRLGAEQEPVEITTRP